MKIKWILTLSFVLLIAITSFASAAVPIKMFVNGQPIITIPPIVRIINGLPFVSIESISSELKLDVDYNEQDGIINISNIGEPQSKVVATLKKAKAALYATEREGNLEKFRLVVDGETRWFPSWRNSSFPSFAPRFFFEDINQDGKEELVVILTTGHGTGVSITEPHVLQKTETNIGDIYEEKLIDNPVAIINKNVKVKKISNDQVEITLGKKKIIDQIYKYFGDEHINFSVYNNKLVAYMSGQLSPLPEGGLLITYQFKDNMYQFKKIKYLQNQPDFIMESSFQ